MSYKFAKMMAFTRKTLVDFDQIQKDFQIPEIPKNSWIQEFQLVISEAFLTLSTYQRCYRYRNHKPVHGSISYKILKLLLRSHVSLIEYVFKYKTVMQVQAAFILAYVKFAERERKIGKGFFKL